MPSTKDLLERVTQLEELVTHQERLLHQLNEVILELRTHQESTTAKHEHRLDHIESHLDALANPMDPNEKPPHY